jgi:hypothetical protein
MNQPTPPSERSRTPITLRLRPTALELLDNLAHEHSLPGQRVTRVDVIRAALTTALANRGELAKNIAKLRDGV